MLKLLQRLKACSRNCVHISNRSVHVAETISQEKQVEEIRIPVPWGHIAGKWWGKTGVKPLLALHGWQDNAGTWDRLAPLLPSDVLRGGDGMAGFAVRHPNGQIVHPYQWKPTSDYQDVSSAGGYYSVCIDNQFSRFAAKLVNLYLTVIRYDQWDKFTKEVEDLNLSVENFTVSIKNVERNINEMLQYQHHSRGREARDYNLLVDNNRYVQNWSLAQIVVITATTVLQVYFVRKLFDIRDGRGRPRA